MHPTILGYKTSLQSPPTKTHRPSPELQRNGAAALGRAEGEEHAPKMGSPLASRLKPSLVREPPPPPEIIDNTQKVSTRNISRKVKSFTVSQSVEDFSAAALWP